MKVRSMQQVDKSSASYQFTMYDDAHLSISAFRPTAEPLRFQCDATLPLPQ